MVRVLCIRFLSSLKIETEQAQALKKIGLSTTGFTVKPRTYRICKKEFVLQPIADDRAHQVQQLIELLLSEGTIFFFKMSIR